MPKSRPGTVYFHSYHAPERIARPAGGAAPYRNILHQIRDGAAFADVLSVILPTGFRFGGTILNLPRHEALDPARVGCMPELRNSDLLVTTTRPPLDDPDRLARGAQTRRRLVDRSGTALDDAILDRTLRPLFLYCCHRHRVGLQPAVSGLAGGLEFIDFQSIGGGTVDGRWARSSAGRDRFAPGDSVAFLFYTPSLCGFSGARPALLSVFGMAGVQTQCWTHVLRSNARWRHRLETILQNRKPHAMIVKWGPVTIPPFPGSFAFMDDQPVVGLLDEEVNPLPEAGGP